MTRDVCTVTLKMMPYQSWNRLVDQMHIRTRCQYFNMDCDTNLRVHERWRNIKQCRENLSHLSGIRSPIFLKLQILRLTCSFDLSRSSEFSAFWLRNYTCLVLRACLGGVRASLDELSVSRSRALVVSHPRNCPTHHQIRTLIYIQDPCELSGLDS
jgi:hypothetical protein